MHFYRGSFPSISLPFFICHFYCIQGSEERDIVFLFHLPPLLLKAKGCFMAYGNTFGLFLVLQTKCVFDTTGNFSWHVQYERELLVFGRQGRKQVREGAEFDRQYLCAVLWKEGSSGSNGKAADLRMRHPYSSLPILIKDKYS